MGLSRKEPSDGVFSHSCLYALLHSLEGGSDFAAGRHRDQRRKVSDKSPYINHLITVATLVANTGCATDPIVFAAEE